MDKVQEWLNSIGIKTANTRYEKAKNNFTVIINHFENKDTANMNKEMNNEEIIEIFPETKAYNCFSCFYNHNTDTMPESRKDKK